MPEACPLVVPVLDVLLLSLDFLEEDRLLEEDLSTFDETGAVADRVNLAGFGLSSRIDCDLSWDDPIPVPC